MIQVEFPNKNGKLLAIGQVSGTSSHTGGCRRKRPKIYILKVPTLEKSFFRNSQRSSYDAEPPIVLRLTSILMNIHLNTLPSDTIEVEYIAIDCSENPVL